MEKEAYLSRTLEENKARCLVCQRKCVIPDGRKGWCSTRINRGGKLFSLIYGEVSSFSINPIEKKPVFHFLPGSRWLSLGSLGCNFRCPGCQNWDIAHWKEGVMHTEYLSPEEAVAQAKDAACTGISWTFNEPTLWFEYTLDSAKLAKERGLYTNYVTNGYMTAEALDMIAPFLDVYRVDVKGFSESTYLRIGHVKEYEGILESTKRAKGYGMHVEVVTNVIPGYNDSETELRAIASWIMNSLGPEVPWHVTRFHPHFELSRLLPTPIETLERARSIGKEEGLWYVYLGNVPGHKGENTYCHKCGGLLIERYVFDVLKNRMKGNQCPACKAVIPGRFAGQVSAM
jgi:pyruvate formate lyase activating enzyme